MQMEEFPNLTPPATTEGVPGSSAGASIRREVRAWARDLLLALALAMVIIIFLYRPVKVEGTSMTPLLSDQERIFINKFVYRFEPIERGDRKSTRLNSSHGSISYAVFCLKKKSTD